VRLDFSYRILRESDRAPLCQGLTHHAIIGPGGKPAAWTRWMERLGAATGSQPRNPLNPWRA